MTTISNNKINDKDNKWVQWIEDGFTNEYINYHDYDEFQNIKCIGTGGFGNVYRANWKSSKTIVALKSLKNDDGFMKELVNEVCNSINYYRFIYSLLIYLIIYIYI